MSWISYYVGRFSGVHLWPVLGVHRGKRLAREAAEEERKREFDRQRLRAEEQRQEGQEKQRVDQLKQWAQAWHECENLRAFIAAWETRVESEGEVIPPGSPTDAWRRWALLMIDKLDPLIPD